MIGCGKIDVLLQLDNVLDLEVYVNYCGFSFGKCVSLQFVFIDFEYCLVIVFIKL